MPLAGVIMTGYCIQSIIKIARDIGAPGKAG